MAKKTVKSNYRVVIYPEMGGASWREGKAERECEEIKAQVIRHVDGVSRRNPQVFIEFDSDGVCEFCGRPWETDPDDSYPLCCDAAVEEWEDAQQPAQQPA